MGRLQTLKPTVKALGSAVRLIDTTPGATPRQRGRAWSATRQRIAARDGGICADCGGLWISYRDHVDHEHPLEQAGSNDDGNLQLLCLDCHERKTAAETAQRFGKG